MLDLITTETGTPFPVYGRLLHEQLGIKERYNDWFPRMCEYGFEEGKDYCSNFSNRSDGLPGKPRSDHHLTLDMAKNLCMIQRTPKGAEVRQYLIEVEKAWTDDDAVMIRAAQIQQARLEKAREKARALTEQMAAQTRQLAELAPKAHFFDTILCGRDGISATVIAKDYGKPASWLNNYLNVKKVQYKTGDTWVLYQAYAGEGYTITRTHPHLGSDGTIHTKVHTYWTSKGRTFIHELLKADGLLPSENRAHAEALEDFADVPATEDQE
jgi:anti-repressor protein